LKPGILFLACVDAALESIGLDPNNAHRNGGNQAARIDVDRFLARDLQV
jgi:hypothetical protein